MMENYIDTLFSLQPQILDSPKTSVPYGEMLKLVPIRDPIPFKRAIKKLAKNLPFKTGSWPSFGAYIENWHTVEISQFSYNLHYCERGGLYLQSKCANAIDLVFEIFRIISPGYTSAASVIAAGLDPIADQRLLIWLRMSSEIYHMLQVNEYFGIRMATYNVTWMCEEFVRMGVFSKETDAFKSMNHILKGLMLSGMPKDDASRLLRQLVAG